MLKYYGWFISTTKSSVGFFFFFFFFLGWVGRGVVLTTLILCGKGGSPFYLRKTAAAVRAALPTPTSAYSIVFVCPNNGMTARV